MAVCFICSRTITLEDEKNNNMAVKVKNIPGVVHKNCARGLSAQLREMAYNTEILNPDMLIGKNNND